ncbi:MAG: RNA polymerase sigma factor, partial [Bacteroidales bacterium]
GCVQKLPNAYRLLFNLSAIDEYSNKEIAELLKQTPNSIKSNLYKAKRALREELNRLKENG